MGLKRFFQISYSKLLLFLSGVAIGLTTSQKALMEPVLLTLGLVFYWLSWLSFKAEKKEEKENVIPAKTEETR